MHHIFLHIVFYFNTVYYSIIGNELCYGGYFSFSGGDDILENKKIVLWQDTET